MSCHHIPYHISYPASQLTARSSTARGVVAIQTVQIDENRASFHIGHAKNPCSYSVDSTIILIPLERWSPDSFSIALAWCSQSRHLRCRSFLNHELRPRWMLLLKRLRSPAVDGWGHSLSSLMWLSRRGISAPRVEMKIDTFRVHGCDILLLETSNVVALGLRQRRRCSLILYVLYVRTV